MKPSLEHINLKASNQSFKFFKEETKVFAPYWHYHPELELTLIFKGQGTRFIGDSILPFNDLDLVLVGKNLPHHWVSQPAAETQIAYVFQFSESLFSTFKECDFFKLLFKKANRGIHYKNPSDQLVKMIEEFEVLNELERLSALMKLLDILEAQEDHNLLASEAYKMRLEKTTSQLKFSRVNNYILEHLDEKLTVNEVSQVAHMVPQSFCRWFKKHSGHSFISFINLTRIERACQLLLTSSDSIQSIAFRSGFETLSHFNRTFKSLKGCSPREFKKRQLKG